MSVFKHACIYVGVLLKPVYLAVLLDLSGTWQLEGAGAAAMAVDRVNEDKELLPGHVLKYSWEDSGCSPQVGLEAIGKLLQCNDTVKYDAVIGPGCTSACKQTSYLSAGQNLAQISWGCTNFNFLATDRKKRPVKTLDLPHRGRLPFFFSHCACVCSSSHGPQHPSRASTRR